MGVPIIVEPIVPAEHLLPGIGEKILHRSLFGRVYDDLQQRFVRMGGIGRLIRLRHLRGTFPGHIGRYTGNIDTLAGLAADRHDAGDMTARPGRDHLIHERGALTETNDLEIPRTAVHVEHLDENIKVRISHILITGRIDNKGRPVGRIQQWLERQLLQEPGRAGLVHLRIRINEERRREIVGTPFRPGLTAIGNRRSRPSRQDDILYALPFARLGIRAQADRQGKGHPKNPFHIVLRVLVRCKNTE